ncbi:DUF3150 domain-containing protein [Marinobacterium aestuariivivens]|uniref:DUF3150 domain-containing protein n=1 Tax=Marinobacterium aestuariivivens TaxID=1698799 RepID=A0ABW2AA67_9GAMM
MAQLGSKKICDPAKLKGFNRLKTETRRLLLSYGMPFMNGFAVPASKADDICDKLNNISAEFDALKQNFIIGYNAAVEEWILENPEYETAIRAGALPRSTVERRIGFEYQVFMIQPISDDDATAKSLSRKVESLGRDLLDEVTEEATKFFSKNLSGREECGVTTRITLKNIRDKVDGLSFLNGAFIPLVNLLDETLRGYEQHAQGRVVKAPFFYQVVAAVLIMSDRKRIEEYANGAVTLAGMTESVTPEHRAKGAEDASAQESTIQPDGKAAEGESLSYQPLTPEERGEVVGNEKAEGISTQGKTVEAANSEEPPIEDLDADMDRFFQQFSGDVEAKASAVPEAVETKAPQQAEVEETAAPEAEPDVVNEPEYAESEPASAGGEEAHPVMPDTSDDEDFYF